jgi:hypothetical protein
MGKCEVEEKFIKYYGKDFIQLSDKLEDDLSLKIGKSVCDTDFVVRFYKNKNHKQFYHNRKELIKSVRRAFGIGAFNHREQIFNIVYDSLEPIYEVVE